MHEINIDTLRNEAQRLITMEIKLLQKMLEEPGVIAVAYKGEVQTFDRDSTLKNIEVLSGERTKLVDLEMVLAVVGTMKAGKSTSINAIVGTEVLPNRNRPMTALPTLIRHTKGQIDPILIFENDKPIHLLMKELRSAMILPVNQDTMKNLTNDSDMMELVGMIRNGGVHQKTYRGADAIFSFLKGLNDLVRLSKELDIDFPFSDYDEIHELPVIEVEFVHLRETTQASGKLTLLDTPGPNESGQQHLRKMLKEQLSKASAVLAILDFTQLKSDADAEVRKELKAIADVSEGRLYTLVNKFDQKDRHGDTAEEVKSYVSETLMEGHIRPEDVFPVSSRWGYLANRARHELRLYGKLPDSNSHPWVADFGEEAFGRRWEKMIGDSEDVKNSADKLWEDSLFHAPLEGVIRTAHARAAGFAIDAAAAKLVDMAEKIDNLLATRETALTKSAKVLQEQINALQQDISRVEGSEKNAIKSAEVMLGKLKDGTDRLFSIVEKHAVDTLDSYFREGKQAEHAAYVKKLEEDRKGNGNTKTRRGLQGIFSYLFENLSNNGSSGSQADRQGKASLDFDPSSKIIKFTTRSDANDLILKISNSVSQIMLRGEANMKAAMDSVITEFQAEFTKTVVSETQIIMNGMKERLKDAGFSIQLSTPSVSRLALNFSGSDILSDVISEKSRTVTKRRRKEGAWGTVCRWFNTDDWGKEEYQATESHFEVDIQKINSATSKQIKESFAGLDLEITNYIKKPLNNSINDFFTAFKRSVEQIRGDLLQSIRDKEHSENEQTALLKRLNTLRKNVPGILNDTRALKHDIEPFIVGGSQG